jgi:hypothetical protein
MRSIVAALCLVLCLAIAPSGEAFVWRLKDRFDSSRVLTFSEQYMYSHQGPAILEQGSSNVKVHVKFQTA